MIKLTCMLRRKEGCPPPSSTPTGGTTTDR